MNDNNKEEISSPQNTDPFYSKNNIEYLENIVKDIKEGKAHFTEHDLIDVDE